MQPNLERYKQDLDKLISQGELLLNSMLYECDPEEFEQQVRGIFKIEFPKEADLKSKVSELKKKLISFSNNYQSWYSESLVIIKLILPDRLNDFIKKFEKPKGRKDIKYENYVIEDYLQRLTVRRGDWEKTVIVGPPAALPQFLQQVNILKSVPRRFESSLFDIKQLVQADLFDSELEAAKELNKKGFSRGAGAMAGVVLESHLNQVCLNHNITVTKTKPTINDYNQLLKDNNIIEIKDWRFIQHLADLRNLCDHDKKIDPTKEEIDELITGVERISKTLY